MRAVIILVVVILAMIALGWLTFRGGGDRATMTIETQKMEQDAGQAIEKGREAVREARDNLRDETAPQTPPPPVAP